MRKKIVVAEKSDAVRSIAESLLHQNGFDVLAARTAPQAHELIVSAEPNMLIAGADLVDEDGRYLIDTLEDNPAAASIPLLIIADPDGRDLAYPSEVILPRPFDPEDFIERVRLFIGPGAETDDDEKTETVDPFSAGAINDEIIDSALGINGIEVEKSEVVDTGTGDKNRGRRPDHDHQSDDHDKTDRKVESLIIRDENGSADKDSESNKLSQSSKLEIDTDQYGLTVSPDDKPGETTPEKPIGHHDYNWFVNEMQKEGKSSLADEPPPESSPDSAPDRPQPKKSSTPGDMAHFISEFKKDISDLKSSPAEKKADRSPARTETDRVPDETAMQREEAAPLDDDGIDAYLRDLSDRLIEQLAEKLAREIVGKINREDIYRILRKDLQKHLVEKK